MKRIKHETAVAIRPPRTAAGIEGYFSPGSPGDGVLPTFLTEDWCNDVQEEICAPVEAAGLALDGEDSTQLLQAICALSARRNVLINAGMSTAWYPAVPAGSSGTRYPLNRWYVKSAGSTYAAQQLALTVAPGNSPPHQRPYALRVSVSSVGGADNYCRVGQCVEGVGTLSGGLASVSFWGRRSAAGPFAMALRQHFGSGGAPSADVNAIGAHVFDAPDTDWHYYTLEGIAVPSLAGKTLGTNGDDYLDLQCWVDAGASVGPPGLGQHTVTFDVLAACLVDGPLAYPYAPVPDAMTRLECARYYENSGLAPQAAQTGGGVAYSDLSFQVPGAATATFWYGTIQFKAIKRATPTITLYNPVNANAQAHDTTLTADCSATAARAITRVNFHIGFTTAPGSAPGDVVALSWAADAELVP